MKSFFAASNLFLTLLLSPCSAFAIKYVDTSANVINENNIGIYCRPTENLGDGRIMVYNTSEADVKILRKRMIDSGVTDEPTLHKWAVMAANNDCTSRAGLNCSGGTCSSGSCQEESKGGFKGCVCK